jgi:hypothetical protein
VSQNKRNVRAALVMKLVQHVQQLGAIYVGGCSKKDVNRIMMIVITRRSEQFFCFCFFVFSCYGFGILLCPFPLQYKFVHVFFCA